MDSEDSIFGCVGGSRVEQGLQCDCSVHPSAQTRASEPTTAVFFFFSFLLTFLSFGMYFCMEHDGSTEFFVQPNFSSGSSW